jgi:hypothetical protein
MGFPLWRTLHGGLAGRLPSNGEVPPCRTNSYTP